MEINYDLPVVSSSSEEMKRLGRRDAEGRYIVNGDISRYYAKFSSEFSFM